MAKECFEDAEIASILNENFICIKLDRDERPDIDRRYQLAVQLMNNSSGWPLTVFMTPDRRPFFGGTYFPLEDRYGRPGFKKVLRMVANFYKHHKDEIELFTERLLYLLKGKKGMPGQISDDIIKRGVELIISSYDPQHGGFGKAPKFPATGATEFLMNRYYFTKDETVGKIAKDTLHAMAKAGIHDQIGGGFHRYSTDDAWTIPHFEKMADDNAWLLRNYLDAYAIFREGYFREVAEGITGFIDHVLSDGEGCFYASQDADVTPDDEGGYFTWTIEELRKILNPDEFETLSLHLINDRGRMHHDPSKYVLTVSKETYEIARILNEKEEVIKRILKQCKKKMLKYRNQKDPPFVDRNIYTSLNGMLISAYLKGYRILKKGRYKDFALKSMERLLKLRFNGSDLFHSENQKALSDDYIHLIDALISSYEVSGKSTYLGLAKRLMYTCIERFWDKEEGGLFDSEDDVFGVRLKGIEDIPHPSTNSMAITLLLKLFQLTDEPVYLKYSETALEHFAPMAMNLGVNGGYYYLSLDLYYRIMRLSIHGEGELTESALSSYRPYTIIRYSIPYGPESTKEDRQYIVPCSRTECYEPIYKEKDLKDFLKRY